MALPVQVRAFLDYWSTRLRIWECGLRNSQIVFELCLCIFNPKSEISNPKCDDSSRLEQGGKSVGAPSGNSPKPGPLGPDSLFSLPFSTDPYYSFTHLELLLVLTSLVGYPS